MTDQQTCVLQEIFWTRGIDKSQLLPEKHLSDDLGLDSLDIVEITMECEKAFKINIPDEEPPTTTTYGGWVKMLDKYVPEKKAA